MVYGVQITTVCFIHTQLYVYKSNTDTDLYSAIHELYSAIQELYMSYTVLYKSYTVLFKSYKGTIWSYTVYRAIRAEQKVLFVLSNSPPAKIASCFITTF